MLAHCLATTDNDNVYGEFGRESVLLTDCKEVVEHLKKVELSRKKYIVWNPAKAGNTYGELLDTEEKEGCSFSSVIETDNINQFIEAVHQETDISLNYQRIAKGY